MLGRREPQGELFRPDHTLRAHVGEDSFHGLLARYGGEWFCDEDFVSLYREDFGRPSVPPSQLCVALLLQCHDGVSDEEAIARSAYDLRWKVALGLELGEKLCAKSTLQRFRAQLVLNEGAEQVMERGIRACREAGVLKTSTLSAAIDTTPILGRGAVKDTFNLVSDGIRRVVEEACRLKDWDRQEVVEAEGLSRHFASSFKGAMDLDWSDAAARRAVVGQLVADARVTLELATKALRGYSKTAEPTQALRDARRLLSDLLAQDIDDAPEDGGGPSIRDGTSRDRIVSTTDPEMRHGRKSHSKTFDGYKAAAVVDRESGVILSTDVRAGNVHDREGTAELVSEAAKRAEQPLAEVLGDTAYGDLETRAEIEALGAEIVAKVQPGTRKGMFSAMDFRIDSKRGLAHCPAGQRSIRRNRMKGEDPGWTYMWSRKDCSPCPLRRQCTKSRVKARELTFTKKSEALWRLRKQQKTKKFRQRYRKRVIVEHRLARLVQLGIRQAKYFGSKKVAFQVVLAATVANLGLVAALRSLILAIDATLRGTALNTAHAIRFLGEPDIRSKWAPSRPGL